MPAVRRSSSRALTEAARRATTARSPALHPPRHPRPRVSARPAGPAAGGRRRSRPGSRRGRAGPSPGARSGPVRAVENLENPSARSSWRRARPSTRSATIAGSLGDVTGEPRVVSHVFEDERGARGEYPPGDAVLRGEAHSEQGLLALADDRLEHELVRSTSSSSRIDDALARRSSAPPVRARRAERETTRRSRRLPQPRQRADRPIGSLATSDVRRCQVEHALHLEGRQLGMLREYQGADTRHVRRREAVSRHPDRAGRPATGRPR